MITDHSTIKTLIQNVLERRRAFEWKAHGLGFLRLYFSDTMRLHVWHDSLKHPIDATPLHDHPWHFNSLLIAGQLKNSRYMTDSRTGAPFHRQELHCGAGGCLLGAPEIIHLLPPHVETFHEGQLYAQSKQVIHKTDALDGTVTLMERCFDGNKDCAHVYYPYDLKFISADFSLDPAPTEIVDAVCEDALRKWF